MLAILSATLLVLAACGDDDDGASAGGDTTQAPSANGDGDGDGDDDDAALADLIEGAKAEGVELTLNWGTVAGTPELLEQWTQGFNEAYGLELKLNHAAEPSMGTAMTRLLQEFETDRPASTDVYLGIEVFMGQLLRAGAAAEVDWAALPNLADPELVSGKAVAFVADLTGITYNTNAIAEEDVPATLEEVVELGDSVNVAIGETGRGFEILSADELWGAQRVREYLTTLADQAAGLMQCYDIPRIASGEFDMLVLDCSRALTLRIAQSGAPLGHVVPTDAPLLQWSFLAIPAHAEHPNTAQLWVNYILSPEAQASIYEAELWDNPLVEGSKVAEQISELEAGGAEIISVDLEFLEGNSELYTTVREELGQLLLETIT